VISALQDNIEKLSRIIQGAYKLLPQRVPSYMTVMLNMADATDGFPSPLQTLLPLYRL
jgi:hypothetical protein